VWIALTLGSRHSARGIGKKLLDKESCFGLGPREPEGSGQALRDQPENRRQVEEAHGVKGLPTGPTDAHSTVLGIEEEAVIVAFSQAHATAMG
jgi:hypothetical protein